MSQEEVEPKSPNEESLGLDSATLRPLLHDAILAYLSVFKESDIESFKRKIFRLHEGGIKDYVIDFPEYGLFSPLDVTDRALRCQKVRAVVDYVLDYGELRKTKGPPIIIREVIHDPLARILEETAIDEAVDTGNVTLWRLPDSVLERSLDEIIQRILHKKYTYLAKCPLGFVKGNPGSSWALDDEVSLKIYSPEEGVRYLSRHYDKLPRHYFLADFGLGDVAVLEIAGTIDDEIRIRGRPPRTGTDIIHEEIINTIDIAKWALMIGFKYSAPLIEARIIYQDILGMEYVHYTTGPFGIGEFRRQFKRGGVVYDLDAATMLNVATLFQHARKIWSVSQDIKDAFWFWGRSCVAVLDRDTLLDSIIGLERLLLPPEPGEFSFRFGLHGSALLTRPEEPEEDAEEKFRDLRKLYSKRGSAAHGGREKIQRDEALKARKNLAEAIASVVELSDLGVLQINEPIAQQIQRSVLRSSPMCLKAPSDSNRQSI
jgi:hypothetical protein